MKSVIFSKVDEIIENSIKEKVFPGATFLIGNKDEIVYEKAYGTLDGKIENDLGTIYDIASLTKVIFTTTLVMKLIEDGKITLGDKVYQYLEEFEDKKDITIFHLLTHTSGLPKYSELWKEYKGKDLYKKLLQLEPEAKAEEKINYSCINFITLMAIVERVEGKNFKELSEKFFKKLGMIRTSFLPQNKSNIAPTSMREGKRLKGLPDDELAYYLGGVSGNAGLFSNVYDLFIFMSKLLKGEIVSLKILNLFVNTTVQIGNEKRHLGWDSAKWSGSSGEVLTTYKVAFGHTGFTGTSIWVGNDIFVILLTNRVFYGRFDNLEKMRKIRASINNIVFSYF